MVGVGVLLRLFATCFENYHKRLNATAILKKFVLNINLNP